MSRSMDNQLVPTHPIFSPVLSSESPTRQRIGGDRGVMARSLLSDGLTGVKRGASLTGIPYIAPISSILRFTLNVSNEMNQYEDDWVVVMDKLDLIVGMLNNLGRWCALHDLKESDLPPSLRGIFDHLRTELNRLRRELEQSKEERSISSTLKRIIMRKDMVRSIKQCDGRLSNLLQTFEIALLVDARFEQLKISQSYQEWDSCRGSESSESRFAEVTAVQSTQRAQPSTSSSDRRGGGPLTREVRVKRAHAELRRRVGSFAPYAMIYIYAIYWFPYYAVLLLLYVSLYFFSAWIVDVASDD